MALNFLACEGGFLLFVSLLCEVYPANRDGSIASMVFAHLNACQNKQRQFDEEMDSSPPSEGRALKPTGHNGNANLSYRVPPWIKPDQPWYQRPRCHHRRGRETRRHSSFQCFLLTAQYNIWCGQFGQQTQILNPSFFGSGKRKGNI